MENLPVWYFYTISAAFGLVVGSFVNVLVVRLPQGRSVVKPSSSCPKCKKKIQWWDNIPLASYLLLGGRCRYCKERISVRYPMIELLTSLLFVAAYKKFGWSPLLFVREWPLMAILVAITFIDLEHRIIPDELSLGGLALGLLTSWAVPEVGWFSSFAGAFLGFGIFYALAWTYHKLHGRSGLGGGDIKLLAMFGAFMGPHGVFISILVSSVLGSLVGILWALGTGRENVMKVAIPYGPFMVIGALYYYLLGEVLWLPFTIPT